MVMESGDKVTTKRVVKGTSLTSTQTLLAKYNETPKEGVDFQDATCIKTGRRPYCQ